MKEKRGVRRGEKGCAGLGRPPAPRHRVEDSADWRAQGANDKEKKKERKKERRGSGRKRGEVVGWANTVGWAE